MADKRVFILGAGLTGLSAAWHLKRRGIKPEIFEKEGSAGGLCRSKKAGRFIFDYDGHLLHFRNDYTLKLVKRLLKGNLKSHKRSAWISNFGVFSRYPFQAHLHALPKPVANECLRGFLEAQASGGKAVRSGINFLDWINSSFGKGIARHFMIPYNRKFWTVPLNRMSCSWSGKFIPCIGYADVVKGFSSDTGKNFGYNSIFWYPEKGGISRLPLAFEKEIGRIGKNCDIDKIDLRNKEVEIKGKGKNKFDVLIMTAPLPELLKIVIPLPPDVEKALKKLRWNSIFNLNIGMEGECQKGKHWIYFPHKNTVFFRAGFFHNFSKNLAPRGKSSLYAEISYSADKPLDKKEAVRKALGGLKEAGVITGKNKVLTLDTNDIKYGYPIYDRNYQKATSTIKNFLSLHGIIACGRYGSWQYMSMEDAILEGKKVAEGISL